MNNAFSLGNSLLARLKQSRQDNDWVDRLHYWISPCMLFILALVIGAKQFVGKPIQCWAPAEFQKQWMQYAEGYCFVENTYFVSMREPFPMHEADREQREITYYQWVPFILLGMALMLAAPKFLWDAFNWKTGLNIHALVEQAHALIKSGALEGKEKASRELGDRMQRNMQLNSRGMVAGVKHHLGDDNDDESVRSPDYLNWDDVKPSQCFVSLMYILFKLLNLSLVLVQLYLLNHFMAPPGYTYWGWNVAQDLMAQRDWTESGFFPRVTFCDFKIRQAAQHLPHHRFTLQCVIMINMFNEKVFLFIWFWLFGLVLLNAFNLVLWLYRILSWSHAEQFILDQLRLTTAHSIPEDDFHNFVHFGLSRDGVTVLRLISSNCEDLLLSSMLVSHLWAQYDKGLKAGHKLKMAMQRKFGNPSNVAAGNPNIGQPRIDAASGAAISSCNFRRVGQH